MKSNVTPERQGGGLPTRFATGAGFAIATVFFLAAAASAAPPGAAVQPGPGAAADEALYLERFGQLQAAFRLGIGLESYQPLEPVPGARQDRPLPLQPPVPVAGGALAAAAIAPQALAAARDYAARSNSTALLVWHAGQLVESSYFKGSSRSTTLPSRSLAKPMTAVAIGRAIELGKIRSLDQPVADFISEWRDDPRRSRIRIRHLLDMRSGLLPQAVAPTAEDILNRAYLHPRHDAIIVRDYPIVDDPGTRFEYNNATSELVALVIERATGRRYAEFLSNEILRPIGALGGEVWIDRPGGLAHSGCCLMLPPETWLRLGVLLLQDGAWSGRRLLPEGYVREMRIGTAQNPWYGLGVYVASRYKPRRSFGNPERDGPARGVLHSEPYLAADLFMFDGNSNQVVYMVPSAQLVILRVGDAPPRTAAFEWDNSFLPNTILRGLDRPPGEPVPRPQDMK